MSTLISGVNAYPATMQIPSDGDPRNASSVNTPIQALADRTTYLKTQLDPVSEQLSQLPFVNYTKNPITGIMLGACWAPTLQSWVVCGGSGAPLVSRSYDGVNWSSLSLPSAGTESLTRLSVDTVGNLVAVSTSRYGWKLDRGVGSTSTLLTASRVDILGSALSLAGTPLSLYDATHNKYVCMGVISAAGVTVRTSTDRNTWIAGAGNNTNWTASTTAIAADVSRFNGRIVAVALVGANAVPATSDDGGATWVARTNFAPPNPVGAYMAVAADPITPGVWYLNITKNTAATGSGCSVYRSTDDGVTWTQTANLNTIAIRNIVRSGNALVGLAFVLNDPTSNVSPLLSSIVYSLDNGTTWLKSNNTFDSSVDTTGVAIALGDGQLLIPASAFVYPSLRYGRSTTVAT